MKQLEDPEAQDKKVLQERVRELEHEQINLRQPLEINRPQTGNYVRNVVISPKSPATIPVGSEITVKFTYVVNKGEEASIFVVGDGPTQYYGSSSTTGTGVEEKTIKCLRSGRVSELRITMQGVDGRELYEMKLPVDYTCK